MLHQNAAAYSSPVFPGASSSFTNPVPGTSQDVGGLDPSGGFHFQFVFSLSFASCLASERVPIGNLSTQEKHQCKLLEACAVASLVFHLNCFSNQILGACD
jgi:hypothetical protein